MLLRDHCVGSAYFEELHALHSRLSLQYSYREKARDLDQARRDPAKWALHKSNYVRHLLRLSILEYSWGMPLSELAGQIGDVVDEYVEECQLELEFLELSKARACNSLTHVRENYIDKLWYLSFAVLFRFDETKSIALANAVGSPGVDAIVDRFEAYLGVETPGTKELAWSAPYRRLLAVFDADEAKRPAAMAGFLKYWYPQNKKTNWWGLYDLITPGKPSYYGYWCFEAAAVVVMLGIDDSSFRDNEYYPADLVDWARAQKEAN